MKPLAPGPPWTNRKPFNYLCPCCQNDLTSYSQGLILTVCSHCGNAIGVSIGNGQYHAWKHAASSAFRTLPVGFSVCHPGSKCKSCHRTYTAKPGQEFCSTGCQATYRHKVRVRRQGRRLGIQIIKTWRMVRWAIWDCWL